MVELLLKGAILSFWLEQKGFPVLHASAVNINGKVLSFPMHSRHGKSTLASTFLQAGASLLTDDILPVEEQTDGFWARPGLPQVNLWPDQTIHFVDEGKKLELVIPTTSKIRVPVETLKKGSFCNEMQRMSCIYLPSKYEPSSSEAEINITQVTPAEAVIDLVRHSFIPPSIFEKLGWQKRRLEFFSRLVQKVPVRRLVYPAGFEHLPRVTEAVLKDLENLPSKL